MILKTRITLVAVTLALYPMIARSQGSKPAGTPPPVPDSQATAEDPYWGVSKVADQYRISYDDLCTSAMAQIETWLKTKRCQIDKVQPLFDRAIEMLDLWHKQQFLYLELWRQRQSELVQGAQRHIEDVKAQRELAKALKIKYEDELADLNKQQDNYVNAPKDEEIRRRQKELQDLVDKKRSEIAAVVATYDTLTDDINNLEGKYQNDLTNIMLMVTEVDKYQIEQTTNWNVQRDKVYKVCGLQKPNTATPLPKGGRGQ